MPEFNVKLQDEKIQFHNLLLFLNNNFEELKNSINSYNKNQFDQFKDSIADILGTKIQEDSNEFFLSQDLLDSLVDDWDKENI